jgi:hypothetical protein
MDDLNRDTNLGADAAREVRRADDRRPDDIRRDEMRAGDEIGEAVGGISGVLTGAALGSLGGPIGTIIGGIAGAVSGWWAGKAISEAASHVTTDDEDYYRTHYERSGARVADRSYDDVRPAYQLGHLASRNPDYANRRFEEVETDLRRGWSGDVSERHGQWEHVRDYARHAFERGRSGFGTGAVAGSATTSAREFDRVSDSPASGAGYGASASGPAGRAGATGAPNHATGSGALGGPLHDTSATRPLAGNASGSALGGEYATDHTAPRLDDSIARAGGPAPDTVRDSTRDTTRGTAPGLGQRAANALDDVKDRIDGNPASRPGPDATDHTRLSSAGTFDRADDAGERLADRADNAWERTKDAASNLGHRAADAIDDTKDRIDGNPASRPGPDRTDDIDRRF